MGLLRAAALQGQVARIGIPKMRSIIFVLFNFLAGLQKPPALGTPMSSTGNAFFGINEDVFDIFRLHDLLALGYPATCSPYHLLRPIERVGSDILRLGCPWLGGQPWRLHRF